MSNTADQQPTPQTQAPQTPPAGLEANWLDWQRALRHKAFFDRVSIEQIGAIADKLLAMALSGHLGATRLLLLYAIGKPMPPVEPDTRDLEEWHATPTPDVVHKLPNRAGPGRQVPVEVARGAKPGQSKTCPPIDPRAAQALAADMEALRILSGGKGQAATSGNRGKKPSPNGLNPADEAAGIRVVNQVPPR
jgi:hypothetical protein